MLDHHHPVDGDGVVRARERGLSRDDAERLGGLLSLIADPVRARLVYALDTAEELCVGDLALALEASEDSVGYGLRLLRAAGLVRTRKAGRVVFYRLDEHFPAPLRAGCLRDLVTISRRAGADTADGADSTDGPESDSDDSAATANEAER